jgi:serine/threonine protein kinase
MSIFDHPRIVCALGANAADPSCSFVISKYYTRGSLDQIVESESASPLSFEQRLQVAIDIAEGMKYLHLLGLLHRDLKPGNVLLDESNRAAITDFDVSIVLLEDVPTEMTRAVGTGFYTSPENLAGRPYGRPTDVYSFGILLWELWHDRRAFENIQPLYIFENIVEKGMLL